MSFSNMWIHVVRNRFRLQNYQYSSGKAYENECFVNIPLAYLDIVFPLLVSFTVTDLRQSITQYVILCPIQSDLVLHTRSRVAQNSVK